MEKPVPRPPTPSVPSPHPEEEAEELAVVLLQRVLKGRAVQNKARVTIYCCNDLMPLVLFYDPHNLCLMTPPVF